MGFQVHSRPCRAQFVAAELPQTPLTVHNGNNMVRAPVSIVNTAPGWLLALILTLTLTACDNANIRTSSDRAAVRARAETAYLNGDWRTAEQHYLYLTGQDGTTAEDWYRLGNIYARTSQPDQAIAAYREALKRDQNNSSTWYNLGIVQLRQATKTFIDMVNRTDVNDPLNMRARYAVTAITELLEDRFNDTAAAE
mgnify:CR=1 FL=1